MLFVNIDISLKNLWNIGAFCIVWLRVWSAVNIHAFADVCSLTGSEPASGPKYAKDIRFREIINVNCDHHKKDIKHCGKMQSI